MSATENIKVLSYLEDKDGFSVRVQTKGLKLWFDMWVKNNILKGDWNAYIFDLSDEQDVQLQAYQEDAENFMAVFDEVEQYLLERDYIREIGMDNYTHTNKYEIDFHIKSNGDLADTIGMRGLTKKEITSKVNTLLEQQGTKSTYTFKIRDIKLA
jgi:hypothetical protein